MEGVKGLGTGGGQKALTQNLRRAGAQRSAQGNVAGSGPPINLPSGVQQRGPMKFMDRLGF